MARRRSHQTTISLFSFQDIITSVCGILIFLTLLLALELIERGDGARAPAASQILAELRRAVERARRDRDELDVRVRAGNLALETVAVAAPASLEREAREAEARAEQVERELPGLEQRAQQASHRQTQAQAKRFDRRKERQELEELRRKTAELRARIRDDEQGDRVYLDFGSGEKREGWLVEVGGDRIAAAPLGRKARPKVFDRKGGGFLGLTEDGATVDFLAWSKRDREAGVYFVIIGRPSGVDRFETLQREFFDAGVPFGFDLVDEDQVLLDSANGAFAP